MSDPLFRSFTEDDLQAAHRLFLSGLDTGQAGFDLPTMPLSEFRQKLEGNAVFVLERDAKLLALGWLSPASERSCYAGVWEISIYVDQAYTGQGLGKIMIHQLVNWSEAQGIWTLQASVFPENTQSLALFGNGGFRIVGIRKRIGKMLYGPMAGIWRDTALFERRAKNT